MKMFKLLLAVLNGVPADAYDDEPIGDSFWKSPEWGVMYRPFGVDYRIVQEAGRMFLEIQTKDGRWVQAQEYDDGYAGCGKLHKALWRSLTGSRTDSRDCYRRIGNGLTGKNVPPVRKILFQASLAA